jgi:tetratricopeptide (TPR) repeat protein
MPNGKQIKRLFVIFCQVTLTIVYCNASNRDHDKIDSLKRTLYDYKVEGGRPSLKDSLIVKTMLVLVGELSETEPEKAILSAAQAKDFSSKINYKDGEARALCWIGVIKSKHGNLEDGLKYFQEAIDISKQSGNKDLIAKCYNNLGISYQAMHKYSDAIASYEQNLNINQELKNKANIAVAYQNIAFIYKTWGKYPEALKCYDKYVKISSEIDDKDNLAYGYVNIGEIYKNLGNYPLGLENSLMALKFAQEAGNTHRVIDSYNTIGSVYLHQKNYTDALRNYTLSLNTGIASKDKLGAADAYENIANTYEELGNEAKSIFNYDSSLTIYKEINHLNGIATCHNGIGTVLYNQGHYIEALKKFSASLNEYKKTEYNIGVTQALLNLGKTNFKMRQYSKAMQFFNSGLALSDSIGSKDYTRDFYAQLASLDSIEGNWRSAFLNQKLYTQYHDSLLNEENIKKTVQIQLKNDFDRQQDSIKVVQDKKELESKVEISRQKLIRNSIAFGSGIVVLSSVFIFFFYKRKRDARQQQKEMKLSLQVSETEMKSLRSQMNPHFIFNALQSIQTFLIDHKPDDANTYLLKFSKLMRLVLENSQHKEISLRKDMQALELYMQLESIRLTHPFTYAFHIDPGIDEETDIIPPLILQPFVENAIWHGLQYKAEPGHIDIYISKKNNELHVIVEDNGVGRDMSKQFQQPVLMKKESLGIKLTEERLKILSDLKKIKAQFSITDLFTADNQPAGTKVELSLPLIS